jgi:hypothetical protein
VFTDLPLPGPVPKLTKDSSSTLRCFMWLPGPGQHSYKSCLFPLFVRSFTPACQHDDLDSSYLFFPLLRVHSPCIPPSVPSLFTPGSAKNIMLFTDFGRLALRYASTSLGSSTKHSTLFFRDAGVCGRALVPVLGLGLLGSGLVKVAVGNFDNVGDDLQRILSSSWLGLPSSSSRTRHHWLCWTSKVRLSDYKPVFSCTETHTSQYTVPFTIYTSPRPSSLPNPCIPCPR